MRAATASNVALKPQRPSAVLRALSANADTLVTRMQGCSIHWRMWGRGRPLLLLHGNAGSWSHWTRNIPFLARNYRVIAVDIPGFGDSDMPPEPYSADSIAALLRESLPDVGIGEMPLCIVGFSFGSSIAGALAKQLGRKAAILVVVSAGHLRVSKATIPAFVPWRKLSDLTARREAHRRNLEVMMFGRAERIDDLAIQIQSENAKKKRLVSERVTNSHPLRDDLTKLSCPFSGIWGTCDRTIGPFMRERIDLFATLGRGGHAHVIEDAGHWHPYEAADRFNCLLFDALAEVDG